MRQLVELPTGCGKTAIFSQLIKEFQNLSTHTKTLVLVHKVELMNQTENSEGRLLRLIVTALKQFYPDLRVGWEKGKTLPNIAEVDVIIASVPSLGRAHTK
jgi:superfamily II DNA or RNA helicase